MFTVKFAKELEADGIKVNAVPGPDFDRYDGQRRRAFARGGRPCGGRLGHDPRLWPDGRILRLLGSWSFAVEALVGTRAVSAVQSVG
ncbi:hypothetical protein [Brevundimonas sp.]|uniref:hypothetical protein n=1 Tax=unclassified Brevundimonas TaxID=2622653 RepID=UPI00390CCEE3